MKTGNSIYEILLAKTKCRKMHIKVEREIELHCGPLYYWQDLTESIGLNIEDCIIEKGKRR